MDLLIPLEFRNSCKNFLTYPCNLIGYDSLDQNLIFYSEKLQFLTKRLFKEGSEVAIAFLELHHGSREYEENIIRNLHDLQLHLRQALKPYVKDPYCRYVFLNAGNSREPLQISLEMIKLLFTYHQVMPSFLDFVFPFGKQIYAQDFHFGGLRGASGMSSWFRNPIIEKIGRSGKELQLCYNLRSVEKIPVEISAADQLPWSIRQCAIYSSFDVETGQSFWVIVKANNIIKERLTRAVKSEKWRTLATETNGFSSILETHLFVCNWSAENWRWYINDLEDQLQALTRGVLVTEVDRIPCSSSSPAYPEACLSPASRSSTLPTFSQAPTELFEASPRLIRSQFVVPTRANTFSTLHSSPRALTECADFSTQHDQYPGPFNIAGHASSQHQANHLTGTGRNLGHFDHFASLGNHKKLGRLSQSPNLPEATIPAMGLDGRMMSEKLPSSHVDEPSTIEEDLTFKHLQEIHYIEEKAQETFLVVGMNMEVLDDLRQHYEQAFTELDVTETRRERYQKDLRTFNRSLLGIKKDMAMLRTRTDNLLTLLSNRKELLHNILQYRSVKAGETFAKEAQESAVHMEVMTLKMHEIATKTKQETVSMRVITTVTLIFLPATFIATFMSTDILKFEDGKKDLQLQGLRIYLAIVLPLTFFTFVGWYTFHRRATRMKTNGDHDSSEHQMS